MSRHRSQPTVPAGPFSQWLQHRFEQHEREYPHGVSTNGSTPLPPSELLAGELGWGANDSGSRRVYRYRHQLVDRKISDVRWVEGCDEWPRSVVEDACHRFDPDLFYELYPEYQSERNITLEPDAWCSWCKQLVTPVDGLCPWCLCEHGHLFREVGVTDDGFACLACLVIEQRARDAENERRRKVAA